MWKSSKRLVISCFHFMTRCSHNNNLDMNDLDDILEYNLQHVTGTFQPQIFTIPVQPLRQEDIQHRPDVPGSRCSSPEIVMKVRKAIEEMSQLRSYTVTEEAHAESKTSYESVLHLETNSLKES
ncbi:uncharacterized protein LOC143185266 isoform X2 [Calliopsis andreniformis]|uniref:uncharacterized protein LOC143185266 isoform X2 n=1 Tax=Calliopsis andreniformis TaxID=337506 RepID=UPI003FCD2F79